MTGDATDPAERDDAPAPSTETDAAEGARVHLAKSSASSGFPAPPEPVERTEAPKLSKADKLVAKAERLREQEARKATLSEQRAAATAARAHLAAQSAQGSGAGRGWMVSTVVLAALSVVLVAALVVGFFAWSHQRDSAHHQRSLTNDRSASLAAAKTYALAFGSYDYQHLDADFTKTAQLMTPSFAANYKKTSAALAQTFTAYKTQVTASVPAAAVVSATSSKAVVLVLLDQVINSSQSTTPKINRNRLKITLVRSGHKWLVEQTDAT